MDSSDLGLIASIIFLIRLVPQPWTLARTGVASGISPLAGLNATVAAVAWFAHGLNAELPIVWVVSALAFIPSVWTNALLARHTTARDLVAALLWVSVLGAAWTLDVFAVALGLGVLVSQGPSAMRAYTDDDLSGISATTWWVSLVDAASWGAYGWSIGDPALIGYFVVLTACSVIVLTRLSTAGTRTSESEVPNATSWGAPTTR